MDRPFLGRVGSNPQGGPLPCRWGQPSEHTHGEDSDCSIGQALQGAKWMPSGRRLRAGGSDGVLQVVRSGSDVQASATQKPRERQSVPITEFGGGAGRIETVSSGDNFLCGDGPTGCGAITGSAVRFAFGRPRIMVTHRQAASTGADMAHRTRPRTGKIITHGGAALTHP
jgi:hypothetical protein